MSHPSFYDRDGLTVSTWTGLSNYKDIFTDPELRGAFARALSLVLLIFYAVLPVIIQVGARGG